MNDVAFHASALGGAVSHILEELRAFSGKMEVSTTALTAGLGSVESVVATSVADLQSVSKVAIDEAKTLRTTLEAAHQGASTAQQSLIMSARELFDQAAQAREAEKKTLAEAGIALQDSTKSLERNIAEAVRVLADSLTQTDKIAKKQDELESKVNRVGSEVAKLDHDTRGRDLLRRVYRARD
jgi:hypothetical protein